MSEQESSDYVVTSINQGDAVQWRHDTMPDGVWRRGVAEMWDPERDCWYVRDAAGFLLNVANFYKNIMPSKDGLPINADDQVVALRLQVDTLNSELKSAAESRDMALTLLHKRKPELDQMHASLLRAEKGHADVQEELEKVRDELVTAQAVRAELEALRLDHAALSETFAEVSAAHSKTYEALAGEVAHRKAAQELARHLSDERDALRAQMIAKEENATAEIERLRKLLDQVQEVATSNVKALRFAKRDVAMHQRRAQAWQGAAADALSQLEVLRASREGEEPGRG